MFDLKLICKFVLLAVILRQEFVNNFSTSTQAPIILPLPHGRKQTHRYVTVDSIPMVNAPVPSLFPRKIYCDITNSIVLNPCRCIACSLLALAPMHLAFTVTLNLLYLSLDTVVSSRFLEILLCFKKRTQSKSKGNASRLRKHVIIDRYQEICCFHIEICRHKLERVFRRILDS